MPTPVQSSPAASKQDAFTLIELLVCIAIFGILVVALGQFLSSFLLMKFSAETRIRMRQEGNYALDRIDFLVRNSVTLPKLCDGLSAGNSKANGTDKDGNTVGDGPPAVLKTNTAPTTQFTKYDRSLVRLGEQPDSQNELLLFNNFGNLSDGAPRTHKHNDPSNTDYDSAYFDDEDNAINLTSSLEGQTGTIPFKIYGLSFTCTRDPFTDGYIVTTRFSMEYDRRTLSKTADPIVEHFKRETPVVNITPWQD